MSKKKKKVDKHSAAASKPKNGPNEIKPIDVWPDGMFHISDEYSRQYFAGYYAAGGDNVPFGEFKGHVERIEKEAIVFNRVFIEYDEGLEVVSGKEDHVWIYDREPFLKVGIKAGDNVRFNALAVMYRRRDGTFDFGLKAPETIEKIDAYELPSDEELNAQAIRQIFCETCPFDEQCSRVVCLR